MFDVLISYKMHSLYFTLNWHYSVYKSKRSFFSISNCVMNPFHDSYKRKKKLYYSVNSHFTTITETVQSFYLHKFSTFFPVFRCFCFVFFRSVSFARMIKWTSHEYDYWILTNWICNGQMAMHTDFYRFKCFNYMIF